MIFWRRKKRREESSGEGALGAKADDSREARPARPADGPAVFEFGGPVSAGNGLVMKGVCSVDDAEAVQACVWRVEAPSATKTPQPLPKFHIEF
ncbi:hypothetical protein WJX81_000867 [Elliptochloris bilobata]|uniref:Uncharacterized protein n=1 Tax=Elliptochloris bilobata TaxID=381761 RepID=A0AAW1S847_9CHLO